MTKKLRNNLTAGLRCDDMEDKKSDKKWQKNDTKVANQPNRRVEVSARYRAGHQHSYENSKAPEF